MVLSHGFGHVISILSAEEEVCVNSNWRPWRSFSIKFALSLTLQVFYVDVKLPR